MTTDKSQILEAFRRQTAACASMDAPFTSRLCGLLGERLDSSSAFGRRVLAWPQESLLPDLLPLRCCAALNILVRAGKAPKIEQDHSLQTYEGWCRAADCVIDWGKPVDEIYNLIRGANPSPGASTPYAGEPLFFYDSKRVAGHGGKAGSISAIDEHGIVIEAMGGAIRVERLRHGKAAKEKASEWAARLHIAPGTQLG